MNNLSFHITDIASNSVRAEATDITIDIKLHGGVITIRISDNGCGMDADTVDRVMNPFYTTRTTRKVGLGIPFLLQSAEQAGGGVNITSELNKGTTVTARFVAKNIDCPPWGDLPATIALLITGNPDINIRFFYQSKETSYAISTEAIEEVMDDIPLSHPKVIHLVKEMIRENIL